MDLLFQHEKDRVFVEDGQGKLIAEITFPMEHPGIVNINHTFVDPVLRGRGVAGKLVEEAVSEIREQGLKAVASCSYAVNWFQKHPDENDILA